MELNISYHQIISNVEKISLIPELGLDISSFKDYNVYFRTEKKVEDKVKEKILESIKDKEGKKSALSFGIIDNLNIRNIFTSSDRDREILKLYSDKEFFFLRLNMTLNPLENFKFSIARIDLEYSNEKGKASTKEMLPFREEDKLTLTSEVGIETKRLIDSQINFKNKKEEIVKLPYISSFFLGQSRAAWEINSTKIHPTPKGNYEFLLIIEQPINSETKVKVFLSGLMVHRNFLLKYIGVVSRNKIFEGIKREKDIEYSFLITP